MADDSRGLPLLSGPPPTPLDESSSSCRKCNKEFNILFSRGRRCNHCGYSYCSSCCDFRALMPRAGPESGYDVVSVCAFCIEFLTITASGRGQLRVLPLSKLKKYAKAYNINITHALEKEDIINAILSARRYDGCLPAAAEDFYRKNSVPNRPSSGRNRGLFSRLAEELNSTSSPSDSASDASRASASPPTSTSESRPFPRPDLGQNTTQQQPSSYQRPQQQQRARPQASPSQRPQQQQQRSQAQPRQQQQRTRPQQAQQPYHAPPHYAAPPYAQQYAGYSQPASHYPAPTQGYHTPQPPQPPPPPPPRPRSASNAAGTSYSRQRRASTPPPVRPPTLDELLEMDEAQVGALNVGALKAVLFTNHVPVLSGMVLEKSELVDRVMRLINDERRERVEHEAREAAELAAQREAEEDKRRVENEREQERLAAEARATEALAEALEAEEAARAASDVRPRSHSPGQPSDRGQSMDGDWEKNDWQNHAETRGVVDRSEDIGQQRKKRETDSGKAEEINRKATSFLERTGLCVICQDEEANIAIVDCGHLAMCRACADLVMASTKECPLCRTRIVTEARLLRIFKS